MIDIAHDDMIADRERAVIGLFLTRQHTEQSRLTRAIGPNHADNAAAWQLERQIIDQKPLAIALPQALGIDDDIAKPRRGRQDDLRRG